MLTRVKALYGSLGICWFHCNSKYYKPHSIDLSSPFTTMSDYQVKNER